MFVTKIGIIYLILLDLENLVTVYFINLDLLLLRCPNMKEWMFADTFMSAANIDKAF